MQRVVDEPEGGRRVGETGPASSPGETLTSTAPGSAVRYRNTAGWRSTRIASLEACAIARASARSSTGRPLTKRYWYRRLGNVTEPRVA